MSYEHSDRFLFFSILLTAKAATAVSASTASQAHHTQSGDRHQLNHQKKQNLDREVLDLRAGQTVASQNAGLPNLELNSPCSIIDSEYHSYRPLT